MNDNNENDASKLNEQNIELKKPKLLKKKILLVRKEKEVVFKQFFRNARELNPKRNNAKILVDLVGLGLYLHRWNYQATALKYATKGYNRRRVMFRKFFNSIVEVYYKHKYKVDQEIFEILKQLPPRPGVQHDFSFWKLKVVNNEVLDGIAQKKLKFWAKMHFLLLVNKHLYNMTLSAIHNMKEIKDKKEKENNKNIKDNNENNKENYKENNEKEDKKNDELDEEKK